MFFGVRLALLGLWGFGDGDSAEDATGFDSVSYAHGWLCAAQSVSNRQTSLSLSEFILAENSVSSLRPCQVRFHSVSLFKDWSLRQNKNRDASARKHRSNDQRVGTSLISVCLHRVMQIVI